MKVKDVELFKVDELQDEELKEILKNQYGAEATLCSCGGYLIGGLFYATPQCKTCEYCGDRHYGATGVSVEVDVSAKTFKNNRRLMNIAINQNIAFLHWGCGSFSMSLKDFIKLGKRLKNFWRNQRTPQEV